MYLSARSWVAVANPALDMEPAATERVKMAWCVSITCGMRVCVCWGLACVSVVQHRLTHACTCASEGEWSPIASAVMHRAGTRRAVH